MVRTHPSQPKQEDTNSVSFLFCFGWDGCYLAPSSLLARIWFVSKSKAIGVLAHQGLDADHFSQEKCSHPSQIGVLFVLFCPERSVRTIFVFAFANTNVVRKSDQSRCRLASIRLVATLCQRQSLHPSQMLFAPCYIGRFTLASGEKLSTWTFFAKGCPSRLV